MNSCPIKTQPTISFTCLIVIIILQVNHLQ
nr:MAG TPA: hypothetical protein [Caudoviricetes sp.]